MSEGKVKNVAHYPSGNAHPFAKLTEETAREARALMQGGMSQGAAARRFNVARQTMGSLLKGRTWAHLDG